MYPNRWYVYYDTLLHLHYDTIRYDIYHSFSQFDCFFPFTTQQSMLCYAMHFFLPHSIVLNCHLFRMPMTIVWVRAIDTWKSLSVKEIPARKYYVFRKGMYTVKCDDDWQRQSHFLTVQPNTHTHAHILTYGVIHDICHACVLNYPHPISVSVSMLTA